MASRSRSLGCRTHGEVVNIGSRKTTFAIDVELCGATIRGIPGQNNEFCCPLSQGLTNVSRKRDRAIVNADGMWMCIARSEIKGYVVINSHCVNEEGKVFQETQARAFGCDTIEQVVTIVAAGTLNGMNAIDQLYGIEVKVVAGEPSKNILLV